MDDGGNLGQRSRSEGRRAMREGRDVRGKYGGEGLVEEELGRELEVKGKSSNWRREKFV